MSMEHSRSDRFRSQPVPAAWGLPLLTGLLITVAAGFVLAVVPLMVQALACGVLTGQLAWPTDDLGEGFSALLAGDFGGGLNEDVASQLPPVAVLWAATAVAELLTVGSLVLVGVRIRRLLGLGNQRGLAPPGQARDALGVARLKAKAPIVRPDAYRRVGGKVTRR